MKTITYNEQTHVLVPREPSEEMLRKATKVDLGKDCDEKGICINLYQVMLAAAPQPEPVESEPVPDFRGYAARGTGQYLLNACPATEDLPAELVISIATEEEKAGRVVGDLKDVEPGTEIDPSSMAVRLAFFSVSGLDALEQQLRILREESFSNTTPQPDRTAELEQLRQRVAELEERRCEVCGYAEHHREHTGCLRKQIEKLTAERDAALTLQSEANALLIEQARVNETVKSALKVAREGIDKSLVAKNSTEFDCACDLSVGYLCGPCHADKQQQQLLESALTKINEVLHD